MNRFGVTYSLAVAVLLAATACHGQIPTSTPCSLSFYRYLFNLPGEKIRPNVPEGTYVFGKPVGPLTPEGQASDARPTVVKPPYEAPLYLPPTTSTTTTTTTLRPSTSAPLYIPPPSPSDFPADSSNSVSVSVAPAKPDCKHPEHQVNSELLPPYRVDISSSTFQPPKFQAPKFEPKPFKFEPQPFKFQPQPPLPKFQPPAFQSLPQLPKFQPAAFQPLPKFQPAAFQPLPKFQPLPAFQPQKPAFIVPQFVAPTIPATVDDNNELTAGQQTQTVVVLQPQPRYPVPTPPPQFLRPYSTPKVHENCDKAHAAVPSTTAASTTTSTTTTTTAAPEPPAETRQNEIFAFPEKAEHKDCTAHHRHEQPEESRGVPSTDYGVVVAQPAPSAGYSYDRPAAPLEYPAAATSDVGYAYPKGSPSFDYPAAAGQFAGQATSLFESEAPGKSSAAGGAEDRGDLYILKV